LGLRKQGGQEEEGGYDEAACHPGAKPAGEEPRVEEGLLYQPLGEAGEGQAKVLPNTVVRLCGEGSGE